MKTVFQSQIAVEAHMILHLLQGAGIEGQVLGEHLQSGVGELPAVGLVRVVVADDREAEARDIIDEWERTQPPAPAAPVAASAQWPRVALGFLAGGFCGAFIVWWALRTPIGQYTEDYDRNGIVDAVVRHAGPITTEMAFDRNEDGRHDMRVEYDHRGLMTKMPQDDDFDGRFELTSFFHKEVVARTEWDRDGDGSPDMTCRYELGVITECQFRDVMGRVVKRESYTAGIRTRVELDTDADGTFDVSRELDWMGEAAGVR